MVRPGIYLREDFWDPKWKSFLQSSVDTYVDLDVTSQRADVRENLLDRLLEDLWWEVEHAFEKSEEAPTHGAVKNKIQREIGHLARFVKETRG